MKWCWNWTLGADPGKICCTVFWLSFACIVGITYGIGVAIITGMESDYHMTLEDGTYLEADVDFDFFEGAQAGYELEGKNIEVADLDLDASTEADVQSNIDGLNTKISAGIYGSFGGLVCVVGILYLLAHCADCNGCCRGSSRNVTYESEESKNIQSFEQNGVGISGGNDVRRRLKGLPAHATPDLTLWQAAPILVTVPLLSSYLAHRCIRVYNGARKPVIRRRIPSRRPSDVLLGFTAP